jgi:predicted ester cyclase
MSIERNKQLARAAIEI